MSGDFRTYKKDFRMMVVNDIGDAVPDVFPSGLEVLTGMEEFVGKQRQRCQFDELELDW